jgi:hypothetical protein
MKVACLFCAPSHHYLGNFSKKLMLKLTMDIF